MPNIQDINTAMYRILKADEELAELCTVYKGAKRPVRASNPSLTVESRHLEPGEGEGIWMCDVAVTVYTDMLANGTPDMETLDAVMSRATILLADAELELEGAKALPLIEGENAGTVWQPAHEGEAFQERVFGLVFVSFQ
jgi:hypothetical protein